MVEEVAKPILLAQQQLEALILQDGDFRRLENSLRPFNIFEALHIVRQELRHSDFLSYLCDPKGNHGLGDAFTRRLMQEILLSQAVRDADVRPMDFDLWDLDDLEVRREWQSIDLLLLSRSRRLAVIIENKVSSGEHSNQLERYCLTVARDFPGFKCLGLYLSPDGSTASSPAYIPVSYEVIASVVDWFIAAMPPSDVSLLMKHYSQMVRRRILEDTELAVLCRQIYARHREALDLLFSYRFDSQAQVREVLSRLIQNTPEVAEDYSTKTYIRFYSTVLDHPDLLQGDGSWTPSRRILLFEFGNEPNRLILKLVIGPGPNDIRRGLLEVTLHNRPTFNRTSENVNAKWKTVFQQEILASSDLASSDSEVLEQAIQPHWDEFVSNTLPKIVDVMRQYVRTGNDQADTNA